MNPFEEPNFVFSEETMASNEDEITDLFQCHVCLENMLDRDPRSLRCNHTFCYQCLLKLRRVRYLNGFNGQPEYHILCPTCRTSTEVQGGPFKLQLPSNFYLRQMQDKLEQVKKEGAIWCEVCKKANVRAQAMCTDCKRMMCQECTNHHKIIPAFAKHQIVQLESTPDEDFAKCFVHNANITSVCQICESGLCLECTLDEKHSLHLTEINEIQTGIGMMRGSIRQTKKELMDKKKTLERSILSIKEDKKDVSKTVKKLQELRETILARYNEVEKLLQETKVCQDPINVALKALIAMDDEIERKISVLENLEGLNDKRLLEDLDGQSAQASDVLNKVEEVLALSYQKPRFVPNIEIPNNPVGKVLNTKVEVVKKKVLDTQPHRESKLNTLGRLLLLEMDQEDEEIMIKAPLEVITKENGNALVVDHSLSYVQEISKEGFLLKKYFCVEDAGCVRSVSMTGKYLYLSQMDSKSVTGISRQDSQFDPSYTINVFNCTSIARILALETTAGDKIIISDDQEGKIKQRNNALVQNLTKPTYMTRVETPQGDCYVVTEAVKKQVRIFDENWAPKACVNDVTKKSKFRGHAATPWGTFLLVDGSDCSISEYSLKGEFVKTVLTAEDGIKNPRDISLCYPYLWLTECDFDKHAAIKLYKI